MLNGFLCKKLLPIGRTVHVSTTQLRFLTIYSPLQSISSSESAAKKQKFTASYLINSCGLSPEAALSASKKFHFATPERPDSVLTLLRNNGFTETQISSLITKHPSVLLADPEKTLIPKFEFFYSMGISRPDLAQILSVGPAALTRSLEKHIIPSFNLFKSVVGTTEKVIAALKSTPRFFAHDLETDMVRNIGFLKEHGVPESNISVLLTSKPRALILKHDRFKEIVEEIKGMGLDPLKSSFVYGIHAVVSMSKSTWKRKLDAYQRWGWSEKEILLAFEKFPFCLTLSEEKINNEMDFLVNKMGWESLVIARNPTVLGYSLEKRIIPRCSVIQVLRSKCLVGKILNVNTVLVSDNKYFLKNFVSKYEEQVPELLDVYEGKIDIAAIGCGFDEVTQT